MKTNAAFRLKAHRLDHQWQAGKRSDHAATGAIVVAADTGRCLLQLRSPWCDTPNTYGQFGGSIDNNEDIFPAFKRELREEAGYTGPMVIRPLMASKHPTRDFTYYNLVAVVPREFKPQINEESNGYKWFHPHEGFPQPLHPGLAALLKDAESMKVLDYCIKHGRTMKA